MGHHDHHDNKSSDRLLTSLGIPERDTKASNVSTSDRANIKLGLSLEGKVRVGTGFAVVGMGFFAVLGWSKRS
jgi:hypothetical protein